MRAACCEATVLRNEVIAPDIRLLTVVWPDRDHAPHAGQFFTLRAWGADEAPFLSRPISVHRWNPDSSTIEFLYQVVGEGTEKIAQLKMKDTFQLTGPMGNGFDVPDILSKYKKIAVVGGGIGTAPMFQLTRELAAAGVKPDVFFGFRDAPYCMEEYREIANLVKVSTDTGAVGFHGFVTQHRHISRDVLMEHVNVLYPMLKAELFLRWDRDELPDVIDALANEMQRQGLITLQDDELHINPAHSRTLQLLAAGARETLQRYAITFWLLSANPSINRGTLEKESRTVAQRLSVLHGINAPEFFDKAVFSSLVLTLRDEGYISDSGDAEPAETMKVYQLLAELITSDVRLTIESATQGEG